MDADVLHPIVSIFSPRLVGVNMRGTSFLLILLVIGASFSGCFGNDDIVDDNEVNTYPSIWDRHLLD